MKTVPFLKHAVRLTLLTALLGCGQKKTEEAFVRGTADLPYGTWQVVDVMKGLPPDLTVLLTLDRFTFAWTTIFPSRQAIFYEAGDIVYSTQEQRMTFRVKTSKVMDQSSGIPKEVFDEPRTSSRTHVPGDQYNMTWTVGKNDVMILKGPSTAITYLRRIKANPADSSVIDVQEGK